MSEIQVVACFVIYSEERIVLQGGFQVLESPNSLFYPSKDGCEFTFTLSYEGKVCKVELTCSNNGSTVAVCKLAIPINRTKIKWKKTKLGMQYDVHYRCGAQDLNSRKMIKQLNRQRAKAATKGISQASTINFIYSEGDSSSNGSGSGSA